MRSSYSAAILLLSAAALGCGGSVIEQSDSASGVGGAGGAGGSVSAGGAGGSGGSVSAGGAGGSGGSSDGGAAGGSGACGNGLPACADNEWCKFDIPGSCGKGDESGTCSPKPEGCAETCPGVCGCDGVFYCHECAARSAGVDASGSTACFPAAEYKAENLYTGAPRFAVFKTDVTRGICVRFIVQASSNQGSGLMPPDGWDFNKIQITNNLSDCQPGPMGWLEPPAGEVAEPIGGAGAMTLTYPQGAPNPCLVSVHGYLEFAPGAPWLPVTEQLDVDDVMVVGGCS